VERGRGLGEWIAAVGRVRRSARVAASHLLNQYDLRFSYAPGEWQRSELWPRKDFFYRAFRATDFNGITGDYLEFGSWGAQTFRLAYAASRSFESKRHLWAFDSFAGLPASDDSRDAHPVWSVGNLSISQAEFHRLCARQGMSRSDYSVIEGFYADTLRSSADELPDRAAIVYVDCDMYTSTMDVLTFVTSRIVHGTVIAFDDYFCFGPDETSGERRAATEVFGAHPDWRLVPFVQFGWHGMSFMVERRDLLAAQEQT
jgi:hypothetical protein